MSYTHKLITHPKNEMANMQIQLVARLADFHLNIDSEGSVAYPELITDKNLHIYYIGPILRYIARFRRDCTLYGIMYEDGALIDSWITWAEMFFCSKDDNFLESLNILENHLTKNTWLVGTFITIADVAVACALFCYPDWVLYNQEIEDRKSVRRYLISFIDLTDMKAFFLKKDATMLNAFLSSPQQIFKLQNFDLEKKKTQELTFTHDTIRLDSSNDESFVKPYSSCVGGRTRIRDILKSQDKGKQLIGKIFRVCGWVRTKREQSSQLAFIEISDGSTALTLQIVVNADFKNYKDVVPNAATGSSIMAEGELVESPALGQSVELCVKETGFVKIVGTVDTLTYPLAKKKHSREFLRDVAHLRPRTKLIGAIARIRSALAGAVHSFFMKNGFLYVHTPIITSADCEGGGEMFQVTTLLDKAEKEGLNSLLKKDSGTFDYTKDFFSKAAFLSVSGQLSVECYAQALCDVYTFGPTFRAENSHTSRHLAEFWMVEPELSYADLNDNMNCAQDFIQHCVSHLLVHNIDDLNFFEEFVEKGLLKRLYNLIEEPFARMSYTDAVDVLIKDMADKKVKFENSNIFWGVDLDSEHERYLTEKYHKKPVIVYNYPSDIKAFYMRANDDGRTCAAMDILAPLVGEVCGGSQREERLDVLDKKIASMDMDVETYWWYRDLRRFGTTPHAGFGVGFDRLLMLVTGVENIKDVVPFPRFPGNAEF